MTEPVEFDYLWKKRRHPLLERVLLSIRYHRKRERFFDGADRWVSAIGVIGGSAAFAHLGGEQLMSVAGAIIAATSTLALVFGFAERGRRHSELAQRFQILESKIVSKGERDFQERDLNEWDAEARVIEASEPPSLRALVIICHNEVAVAAGKTDCVVKLPWHQRVLAQWIEFSS